MIFSVTNFTMKYPFPKNTLFVPLILLFMIWGTFLLQYMGLGKFSCYGIVPRNFIGLRGILFAPLFHAGWKHIINNSIPLAVLSFFAVLFYQRMAYYVIIFGWLLTGLLVWLGGNLIFGHPIGCHIGASGIVYLLASFVFFSGILRKSRNLIAISLIVAFLYGSMVWGVIPEELLPKFYKEDTNPISWESHLAGAVVGFIFAFIGRNYGPQEKKYSWEYRTEPDSREKWLWERYKESLPDEERIALEEKYGEQSAEEPKEPKPLTEPKSIQNPDKESDKDKGDYWFTSDTR